MATLEEKQIRIMEATEAGFRGRLLARGQARSIIWHDGQLPDGAPEFSPLLSYDLLSYGYALLSDGLDVLEDDGDPKIARTAFSNAAWAIESVISRGQDDTDRDFHRFVAAATYHLAGYSARAYSLLAKQIAEVNLTLSEKCLAFLMIRSLDALDAMIREFKLTRLGTDDHLTERLAVITGLDGEEDELDIIDAALTDGFMSAMAMTMLAFERGDSKLLQDAREKLKIGMRCCSDLNFVPQWWCHRLAMFLIGDLWDSSFHERLPIQSPDPAFDDWPQIREIFIASLYRRSQAEIDLWPSQLDAASRALDLADNMVVSLPTSAGKTRIAEICILACLASRMRVMFVTPLRALSAQTESVLERTFTPLGKTVSSLYGGIGVNSVDEHLLRERNIVIATPEKLDFALRNEPSLLDDVGLIVFDEGHMIGLGEREVRYEIQIQRLLRRSDAAGRRIICLSAVLPESDKLDDFVGWLTGDSESGLIQENWRPTRLLFGEIRWQRNYGRLVFTVDKEERPFVPRYITETVPPSGRRKKPFPCDQRELCLATAWRLVKDGQTVLIFCPLRKSVEPFAKLIVDLHGRGILSSLLDDEADILDTALAIGAEWFSSDYSLLACLRLGVAVHHGALPTPYRREVERLLRLGKLKITISSPTLAQGLNLTASALVFHGLYRNKELIDTSEFRNVIGRAGRAFIDVEGQVLYPMFDKIEKRGRDWKDLIEDTNNKEMESGLLLLVRYLLKRMIEKHRPKDVRTLSEYVTNANYWEFPELTEESAVQNKIEEWRWRSYVSTLDAAILGLIGDKDIRDDEIEEYLDIALQSSFWMRCLEKREKKHQKILKIGLIGRSRYIWSNTTVLKRKAYFFAGVGLKTGLCLDEEAKRLGHLLAYVNQCIQNGNEDEAIEGMIDLSEIIFKIFPFTPNPMPDNWKTLLIAWLNGDIIAESVGGDDPDTLKFIEDALLYRLPWGMEAVRVRGLVHNDEIEDGFTLADYPLDFAVAAVETGTLKIPATVLMKSGFGSRIAAIKAVNDGNATFTDAKGLRNWIGSDLVKRLDQDSTWPTPETHDLWHQFVGNLREGRRLAWRKSQTQIRMAWLDGNTQYGDLPVRLVRNNKYSEVLSPDYEVIGKADAVLSTDLKGILHATISKDATSIKLNYIGPENSFLDSG